MILLIMKKHLSCLIIDLVHTNRLYFKQLDLAEESQCSLAFSKFSFKDAGLKAT